MPWGMEASTPCPPPRPQPLVQPGEHPHTLSTGYKVAAAEEKSHLCYLPADSDSEEHTEG